MKTKTTLSILLLIVGVVLISGCVQEEVTQECGYSGYGDWQITGEIDCSNKEIVLNGNLIVSGSLSFNNITLLVNSQGDGQYKIDVLDGGNFEVVGGKITASNPDYGYQFYYSKGSDGFIDSSVIEYTSMGEDVLDTGGHGGVGGLNVFTDGFVLKNSIIRNSKGRGILVGAAKNILVLNNTFADNGYDGVRVYNSSNVVVKNNTGYGNNEYAIKAMYSKNVTIRDNVARNNERDGIHLHTCENVLIEGNKAFDNGNNGIQVGPGLWNEYRSGCSNIVVRDNLVKGNENAGIVFFTTSNSEISNNIVEGNKNSGIIVRWTSNNNLVMENTVSKNNYSGIVVVESNQVNLTTNKIIDNGHSGIVFESSQNSKSSNNVIKNHGFHGPMAGIFMYNSTGITISNDYIENSTAIGIDVRLSEVTITDATIKESKDYDVNARENSSAVVTNCDCEKLHQDDTSSIQERRGEAGLVVRAGENGTYSSIQKAIDSARDGATIRISRGTYLETITITAPKTLTLQGGWNQGFTSRSDDSSLTVIDGGGNGSVVNIRAGPGVAITLTIEGFTIRNGKADKGGGGISILSVGGSVDTTLVNNTISGNTANNEGGGIRVESGSGGVALVTLTGNVITGNNVTHLVERQGGWDGGGVAAFASGSGTTTLRLTNNLITGNEAAWGGGVFGYAWGSNATVTVVLTNNIITGNEARAGGGIFSCSGQTCPISGSGGSVIWTLTNNIITGNMASEGSGGIHFYSGSSYGDGGLISLSTKNDILWGNTDPQLAVSVEEGKSGVATAEALYSDIGSIWSSGGGNYTLENVINADPLFVDPTNQIFLLQDGSPCVDTGDPGSAYNDGCRPPAKGTERNDMGAYGGPDNCYWSGYPAESIEQEQVITGYIRDCSSRVGENVPVSARIAYGNTMVSTSNTGYFSINVEGDPELLITARGYRDYTETPSRMVDNAFYLIPSDVYEDLYSVVWEEQIYNTNNWMRKWTRQPEIIIAKEEGNDIYVDTVVSALSGDVFNRMTGGLYSSENITILDELPEELYERENRDGKIIIYFADEMMDGYDVAGGAAHSIDNQDGNITFSEIVLEPSSRYVNKFTFLHELTHTITAGGHINYKASIVSEIYSTPNSEPTESDYELLNCIYNSPLKRSN